MGQALYRKHRPKSLKQVIGQEHITQTLEKALEQDRISHAYLFTGPRGVGKTSIARILAHAINDLPYDDDSAHMDIIEIDAASNRRIDEIRELRDKVYIAPTSAKYKVYIIDEVHMLTREAFNALLKTLEEPPAHVVFILATTDIHKLPATIISRTQRFGFKPASKDNVLGLLQKLASDEGVKADKDALELIAEHGQGSFRDSVSLLDQASNHSGKLTVTDVQRLLGLPSPQAIDEILAGLEVGNPAVTIQKLDDMYAQGIQASSVASQLGQLVRTQLINNQSRLPAAQATELLKQLIEVPAAHNPSRFLEICLLQANPLSNTSISRPADLMKTAVKPPNPSVNELPISPSEPELAVTKAVSPLTPAIKSSKPMPAGPASLDIEMWQQALGILKQRHNTLYGVVRMAQPAFDKDIVRLTFSFAFHQKRISDPANRTLLSEIIKELTGKAVNIECLFDKTASATPAQSLPPIGPKPQPRSSEGLATISNIFGGAELLES